MTSAQPPSPPPLDEEELAFRRSVALLVEFFRIGQRGRVLRAFLPAAVGFVPAGGLLVGLSLSTSELQGLLVTLGLILIALGPASAAYGLLRAIREDRYVAIRVDGLALRLDGRSRERLIAWDDIVAVEVRERRLLLSVDCAEELDLTAAYDDIALPELGARIRDARRRALWGRLKP